MHFIGNIAGATLAVAVPGALLQTDAQDDKSVEIESSSYWEDDAWWDITEWFDGNDFNSTREAGFELDPKAPDKVTRPVFTVGLDGYDSWYGYDGYDAGNDWFYDFYDDGYTVFWEPSASGVYRYSSTYYDYDGDGYYDAFYHHTDRDGDGVFEDLTYSSFDETSDEDRARSDDLARGRSSAVSVVTGEVGKVKRVSTRNAENRVAWLQREGEDALAVDLGPVSQSADLELTQGTAMEAHGPIVQVGDQPLMLASRVMVEGVTHEIAREGMPVEGTLMGLKESAVNGREHTMAVLSSSPRGNRWLIDLGPSKALDAELKAGERLTVRGVPCRKDRKRVLMARKLFHDGRTEYIDRSRRATEEAPTSGSPTDG